MRDYYLESSTPRKCSRCFGKNIKKTGEVWLHFERYICDCGHTFWFSIDAAKKHGQN